MSKVLVHLRSHDRKMAIYLLFYHILYFTLHNKVSTPIMSRIATIRVISLQCNILVASVIDFDG